MKKFKLHWLSGEPKEEIVEGTDIADAFAHAGYSAGAIRALDWFEEIKENKKMKKFKVFWITGQEEEVEGDNLADAFRRAGYLSSSLLTLDNIEEIKEG